MGLRVKFPILELHAHVPAQNPVRPQSGAHGLAEGENHLAGGLVVRHVPGQGDAVAVTLVDGVFLSHRVVVHAVCVTPDGDGVFLAQMGFEHLQVAGGQLADGVNSQVLHLALGGAAHKEQLPDGQRPQLDGISWANSVWHLSGFSKSEAILASSLLGATPMLTVKPSSSRMRSRIRLATSRGCPKRWMVGSCRGKSHRC